MSHNEVDTEFQTEKLAANLDAAERAWLESDQRPDEYDYEDHNGHLQHRADKCPLCILAAAKDKYFSLVRVPALDLYDDPPTDIDKIADLTPIVYQLWKKLLAAQARLAEIEAAREDGYSVRAHLDAEAAVEFAETEYAIYERPWRVRIERQRAERQARRNGHVTRSAVTDGYVKTRKIVLVDGVRVPVVRKVEPTR